MLLRLVNLLIFTFLLIGCENLALLSTAPKMAYKHPTLLSQYAEEQFWQNLHHGRYDKIPITTKLLTAAYLKNPYDPELAAHLGFLHIWKITERKRLKSNDPTIVNEIILARKYFADAVELNPKDARYLGFLGDSLLIEGKIFYSKRNEVKGYYILKNAIHLWPEFNYFTAGYPMSSLSSHTWQFKEGLNWQWKTLDLCAETRVNRNYPDFSPYLYRETKEGKKRACWNSWIAPHNFEGFFLNMGDMLIKQGDWQKAIIIYNNAKLSKTFSTWPYRKLLKKRILHAKKNVVRFQTDFSSSADEAILFNSGYGCMVCHQKY